MQGLATIEAVPHDPPAAVPELLGWPLVRTVVAFDTTSRDSNLALIDGVREYLAAHGVESTLTFDDERRKANLFAALPAQDGNAMRAGVVLSGHTDVVPVDGQPLPTNPFEATRVGERVTPGFDAGDESAIAALGRSCLGDGRHGKVSFGSEAALFDRAGMSAIVCGPGHIAQAHQPNEWATVEQLARCEAFMDRLVERLGAA